MSDADPPLSSRFSYRPACYEDAVERWAPELTRVAKSVGRAHDWEDVCHDIWTQVFKSWTSLTNAASPLAYALRIAARTKCAYVATRRKRAEREEPTSVEHIDSNIHPRTFSDGDLDLVHLVSSVLQELKEVERTAYEYAKLWQYTQHEVAAICELPPREVANLIRKIDDKMVRARAKLLRKKPLAPSASTLPPLVPTL